MDKKWFISDARISSEDQDAFSHIDYARELKAKILELPTPLTIALAGQHGTGKSSIGVLLEKQFENDPNFEFVRIEAWRHEGETRRKAFLYDVLEGLTERFSNDAKRQEDLRQVSNGLYNSYAHQTAVLDMTGAKESVRRIWETVNQRSIMVAAAAGGGVIALLVAWYFHTVGVASGVARTAIWTVYPMTLSVPFVAAALAYFTSLVKQVSEKVLEPAKITVTSNPPSSAEQYEQVFRKALQIALKNGKHLKTMVLFVDELDRLPPSEIIQALQAIRTFRDVEPCVFVVGLDEEIVKRAIIETRVGVGLVEDSTEAEEFLNKFFKLRQHVPLLISRDMREFARGLVSDGPRRRINDGIAALPKDALNDVLDALIHRKVKTPRDAIRLLNAFNGDYRLATVRESAGAGLLSRGAITDHLPFLAVVNVLREDYPDFYAELLRNQDLLFALDMLQEGKSVIDVERAFPTYSSLCASFYTIVSTEPSPNETEVDYSRPQSKHRDLFLHLRNTAKFRAPSLVPFIYLREDQAARILGSSTKEEMAEDFESNAVTSLRSRIREGTSSFATAAAQVAIYCMDDASGIQLENTLLATCELFDDFDPELRQTIANEVALKSSQNGKMVTRVDPFAFLKVLSLASPSPYISNCLRGIIARLNPEDVDPGRNALNALIRFCGLLPRTIDLGPIRIYTAALSRNLPITDLDKQIQTLIENPLDEITYTDFFGQEFLQGVAETSSGIGSNDIPADYAAKLGGLYQLVEPFGLAKWKEQYFHCCIELLNSRTWDLHEVGFSILKAHKDELSITSAENALNGLFANGNVATLAEDLEHHEQLQQFARDTAQRVGQSPFAVDTVKTSINEYLTATFAEGDEDVRALLRDFVRDLSPIVTKSYFDGFSDNLITLIPAKVPTASALDALQLLPFTTSELSQTKIKALYEVLTLPVRQVVTGETATFGATAMILALEQKESVNIREIAKSYFTGFVGLVLPNYTPENLAQIARVLDASIPYLAELTETYANNLETFIVTGSPPYISFAIARLNRLASSGSLPATSLAKLTQALISMWSYIPTAEGMADAARLLFAWRAHISENSKATFWTQQIALLESSPRVAWQNLSSFWQQLPQDVRVQAIRQGYGHSEIQEKILSDLSDEQHKISSNETSEIILQINDSLDEPARDSLALSMTTLLDNSQKEEVSVMLFTYLRQQPEKLNQKSVTSLASSLSNSISAEGFGYFLDLFQGDQDYRSYAFNNLLTYLDGKILSGPQSEQLALTLATDIDFSNPELTKQNIQIATRLGLQSQTTYKDALGRKKKQLTSSKDNADKEILKIIRASLRK